MSDRLFLEDDGMDEDGCLMIYDNDYSFYKLVLETFRNEIPKTIKGMKDNYDSPNPEDYRIYVHGLKGSGGSAGARHLVELATQSNALIKEGRVDEAKQMHDSIIAELERLDRIIPERIRDFGGQ